MPSCPSGGGLFFSQYQEASSGNNRYLQIFNPTAASIDLASGYFIGYCANGCAGPAIEYTYSFPSGATIAAGGTYSICNSGLGDTTGCHVTLGFPSPVHFNGDDFHALCSGTTSSFTIVDQVGKTDISTARTMLPHSHCVISLHGSHNAYALPLRVCVRCRYL